MRGFCSRYKLTFMTAPNADSIAVLKRAQSAMFDFGVNIKNTGR